ncbi:MAG: hypothetical protein ACP5UV_03075 [Thermoplasmata archaeon]
MIYATCPKCGYIIDVFSENDLKKSIRANRLKYLTTRDQICPNCVNTISKCKTLELNDSDLPIFSANTDGEDKSKIAEFARKSGYAEVTDYTIKAYKGGK